MRFLTAALLLLLLALCAAGVDGSKCKCSPEGSQNPLQRREEAGDEAKVPALRGEDGYHHHQKRVQIPGSGALPAPQAAEHQEVHQVVQCLEREAQGLRRIG